MKRYGNLFDQCFTIDSLYIAYKEARKRKRHKPSVIEFEKSLGTHIEGLHRALHDGSYRPEPYTKFTVWEPKERTIYAPSFKDVVVQHAIYRVIYPLYDATFINQSHGCRKEHGTHSASRYAQWAMNQCDDEEYYLQLDIRKFFYSIDRGIIKEKDPAQQNKIINVLKSGSIIHWQHINFYGEYDFTEKQIEDEFDIEAIKALSVSINVPGVEI